MTDSPVTAPAGRLELLRAADALASGDTAQAEQICRAVLRREPRNVAAMRLLAEVGMVYDRFEEAEELLDYCLELAPGFHQARHSLASLFFRTMRFSESLQELDRVLQVEPDHVSALLLQATIHAQTGRTRDSIEIYESVLRRFPGQARIHLNHGHALKAIGRQGQAIAAYQAAIKQQPGLGEPYWSLANLKTFSFDDELLLRMQQSIAGPLSSAEDRFHLNFALGKAYEDRQQYDKAFQRYAEGNAARRLTVHWDADRHAADLARIATFFTPAVFEKRVPSEDLSAAPIFIVGMPRAGSTLLEQILASHSQVEGTTELGIIIAIARRLARRKSPQQPLSYPEVLATLSEQGLADLGNEYLERSAIHRSGAAYFIDKMPNNFPHIGLIRLILPNARILDARRHPMACCFSVFKQLFANGQAYSYTLEELGRYYGDYVEMMSHWDAVLPGFVCRVSYEKLIDNFEVEVRRVLEFCQLDFETACLDFHKTKRIVHTPSSEQVRQPIYTSAVEHWRHFEKHLVPLQRALVSAGQ